MGVGIPTEVGCYLVMMAAVDVLKSQKVLEGEIGESKRQLQMKILQKKDMLTEETGEHFELYFARNVSTTHSDGTGSSEKRWCLILLLYVCL